MSLELIFSSNFLQICYVLIFSEIWSNHFLSQIEVTLTQLENIFYFCKKIFTLDIVQKCHNCDVLDFATIFFLFHFILALTTRIHLYVVSNHLFFCWCIFFKRVRGIEYGLFPYKKTHAPKLKVIFSANWEYRGKGKFLFLI